MKKMKIGILTLPLHTNYGGILQAYALQTVLKRLGHEVAVINKSREPIKLPLYRVVRSCIKRILLTIVKHRRYRFYNVNKESEKTYADFKIKTQYTQKFVDRYIDCYYVANYKQDIKSDTFDAIVVGSDQIWSREHGWAIDGNVANAYLPFLLKTHPMRIAYAASFGKDSWAYTEEQEKIAKLAVRNFVAISVREKSGIDLCKKHLGAEAIQLLDPTMLLNAEDYVKDLDIRNIPESPGNMLVYVIDGSEEKDAIVQYCEQKFRLRRFNVNSRAEDTNLKNKTIEDCIQPPVEQWIRGFLDAKFVVTDSFHACVFSILFHKPFIVVGNKSRGMARFVSLLSQFDLCDRLVQTVNDVYGRDVFAPLSTQMINKVLVSERERSMKFLKQYLA